VKHLFRLTLAIACAVAAASLAGCGRVADYARVVEANRLHERGDYQGAIVAYARAGRAAFPATVDYDLANTYARLGEYGAAAELYAAARREGGAEGAADSLIADAYFNEGVAHFERGSYEESWKAFRAALAREGLGEAFARDARRNLELAWRAWKKSGLAPPQGIAASSRSVSERDESELRLLQRLETGRWRPGASSPSPSDSSDY
jgi:tetratricopeptide (TPR) repeat protein